MNSIIEEVESLLIAMTDRAMPALVRNHEVAWAYNPSRWNEYTDVVKEAGEHARRRGTVVQVRDGWAAKL